MGQGQPNRLTLTRTPTPTPTLPLQVRNEKLALFLSRDFASEANRTAALKNGYALLGQQRHELAAAFFVLGGSVRCAASLSRS